MSSYYTHSATPGILHHISQLSAFEPTPTSKDPQNLLIWTGGLGDTYHSVNYPYTLSKHLPPGWSIAQAYLSSAAQGWGTSSLGQDVEELSRIIGYFKRQRRGRIVIMGHSTGCQDSMHYISSGGTREKVDGVILQAPVSDREMLVIDMPKETYEEANRLAKQWIGAGRGEDCLPSPLTSPVFGPSPVTARRWLSLASPDKNGEDDYFSSDLPDERLQNTFGKINVPLLILIGENDQYVPRDVDKKAMVDRWISFVEKNGGVVDRKSGELLGGASHNLNDDMDEVVDELIKRVIGFLQTVV